MEGATETLASVGQRIRDSFQHLETSEAVNQPTWAKCDNEMQRFELWARNLGLYTGGHSSLDYRFRDAQLLFDHTLSLLSDLARILTQLLRVVEKDKRPDEQEIFDDSEEEDVSSYQGKPLFALLTDNATATVDKLYRLAFKIRNPAMRLGSSRSLRYSEIDKETGVDLIEQFAVLDHQYIRDLFLSYGSSHAENHYLIPRLAKANTRRRQQFRYWKKRREAFELLSLADLVDEDTGVHHQEIPGQQEHLVVPGMEPISFAPSQPSTATWLNAERVRLDDDMSVISTVSFLPSSDDQDTDSVSLPLSPDIGPEVKEFECPYCFTMCPQKLANQKNWETHILRDLRPYICTYQHCKTPDQPYDSLSDWVNHEVHYHGGDGLRDGRGGDGPSQLPPTRDCPFCPEAAVSPFHVASHLHRIATFSLPRSVGDDDVSDGTSASDRVDMNSGESRLSVPSFSSTPKSKVPSDPPDELNRRLEALMQNIQDDETNEALVQKMHPDETGGSHVQSGPSGLGGAAESAVDEEEENPGLGGDAAQPEGETGNNHWPSWLVADIALAISKALSPKDVTDRAPFLRFLPLMDHNAILNLRTEYKKIVQTGGKGVNVAKHIRAKLGRGLFGDACYATALGQWESEVFWITASLDESKSNPDYLDLPFLTASLLDRDDSAILAIKTAFKSKKYNEDLSKFVVGNLRDETLRLAFNVALGGGPDAESGARTVEEDILYLADQLRQYRWDLAITSILVTRAMPDLRSIWQSLKDRYGLDLLREIEANHGMTVAQPLAYVIEGALNRPLRDANMLRDAIGNGQDRLLTAYLVRLHWNPGHFVAVKAEFRQQYGTSVEEAIAEKFPRTDEASDSGDWRDFCIELAMSTNENSGYNPPSDTLHIPNIPSGTSYDELRTLFLAQPGYKGFRMVDGAGSHVKFEDAHTAGKALSNLTGYRLSKSGKIGIRLNFANSADAIRARYGSRRELSHGKDDA